MDVLRRKLCSAVMQTVNRLLADKEYVGEAFEKIGAKEAKIIYQMAI